MPKKKGTTWSTMTKEEKIAQLSALWRKGLSDEKIATELRATKGQVVGFRHTQTKLTSANRHDDSVYESPAVEQKAIEHSPAALPETLAAEPEVITPSLPAPQEETRASIEVGQEPAEVPTLESVTEQEPAGVIEINIRVEVTQIEPGCVWPMAKSSTLHAEDCGRKVVPGFRCCEEHAPLLYGKRFTARKIDE